MAGIPPSINYSGGIFLKEMLEAIDFRVHDLFVVQNRNLSPVVPDAVARRLNMAVTHKPWEQYFPGKEPHHDEAGIRREELASLASLEAKTLPAIRQFASRNGCSRVWIILEGQTLIRLADALTRAGDLPIHVQVMDPPRSWLKAHRVDAETTQEVLGKFASVLSQSQSCAAASWAMAARYRLDYGANTVPVVPSLPEAFAKPAGRLPAPGQPLRIGFAGQIYAKMEWERLLNALDLLDWTIDGHPVGIDAFAQHAPTPKPQHASRITFHPWTEAEGLIDALAACDVHYCPYRFDPEWREDAELCFPSKVTTYLASGRPVLFHGPAYSSPSLFLAERDAGFLCNNPIVEDLAATLQAAFSDPCRYDQVAANAARAFRTSMTHATLAEAMGTFLAPDTVSTSWPEG